MHISCVTCILCFGRSLDLTHYWCLSINLDPENNALVEAPVAGDYGWVQTDQAVELEDGVPAQGV